MRITAAVTTTTAQQNVAFAKNKIKGKNAFLLMQLSLIEDISFSLTVILIVETLHFPAKKVAKFAFLQYTKKLCILVSTTFDDYQIIKHLHGSNFDCYFGS